VNSLPDSIAPFCPAAFIWEGRATLYLYVPFSIKQMLATAPNLTFLAIKAFFESLLELLKDAVP